ncbi:MAG: NADH-quinone oxidoreductase subunit NuoK [Candidatus Electryonea clarkiae]|nr:NADH-quinone oxidoreductase subunit NuoK [Candidatus Electryonea clarkiae]MDP8288068.1 NADH-quinone oxidoreductase subunit NuoK [Candidatus Electryonea clarkiae]
MELTLNHYLILSAIIFAIGVTGVLTRRNVLIILMSVELMLNSANMTLIAFSHYLQNIDGMVFVFFTMTVAAAEVGIGLAIVVTMFRNKGTIDVGNFNLLKG